MKKDNKKYTKKTPRFANDNLNQGRTDQNIESTYQIIQWAFVIAILALIGFVIYYSNVL